jgi:hypothetical protein
MNSRRLSARRWSNAGLGTGPKFQDASQTAAAPHDLLLEIGRDARRSNQALHSLPKRQAALIVKYNPRDYVISE